VLDKTYGALADLRRELVGLERLSPSAVRSSAVRACSDPQRAWLLLEDYFETALALASRFHRRRLVVPAAQWPPRAGPPRGNRPPLPPRRPAPAHRTLPTPTSNASRRSTAAENANSMARRDLEHWLIPPAPGHLDAPRAACGSLRTRSAPTNGRPSAAWQSLVHRSASRAGEKERIAPRGHRPDHPRHPGTGAVLARATGSFIQWLAALPPPRRPEPCLDGLELLHWLVRWGPPPPPALADTAQSP
jgi:hypothetical protein